MLNDRLEDPTILLEQCSNLNSYGAFTVSIKDVIITLGIAGYEGTYKYSYMNIYRFFYIVLIVLNIEDVSGYMLIFERG